MAESQRLAPYTATDLIEPMAITFGLDPDLVWQKETDDVLHWAFKLKERAEYNERFRQIDRAMNQVKE